MNFDREMFADKLKRYCTQFTIAHDELSKRTGISPDRIQLISNALSDPTGDEVLIISDFFKCDYKFFISNEQLAPFEQTESLFRKHGDNLTVQDRWAIQEFLFLCECEHFISTELQIKHLNFHYYINTQHFKGEGKRAAASLRAHLEYPDNGIPEDIYSDFRRIGIHVFRRSLQNSTISGLYIKHPTAGPCILINYDEDVYRQKFSAAHEAAHAILDNNSDFTISYSSNWDKNDLVEIRANTFARHYLIPPSITAKLSNQIHWTPETIINLADKLKVNISPLLYSLKDDGHLTSQDINDFLAMNLKIKTKQDPEIPSSLSAKSKQRKLELLQKGLSSYYVEICFDAYESGIISAGRLAEILLLQQHDLPEIAELYGRAIRHEHQCI